MRIFKMCARGSDIFYTEIVTSICGGLFALSAIIFGLLRKEAETALCCGLALSFWIFPAVGFLGKLSGGYIIEKDGIYYKYWFRSNKLYYQDINCIIISNNAYDNRRIMKEACVTIIGGEQNDILQYCTQNNKSHVLTRRDIEYKLGASIGFHHSGNIWELFKKGSTAIHNYDFGWNKKEMYKLLEGYQGNYYIAASVISNFKKEFDDIVERYGIADERIHILDDSTNGKFILRW